MYPGTYAETDPDRAAVIMAGSGERLTFGELERNSRRLAHRLRAEGFRRGDVIALLSGNDPRVFEVYWAAQRSGLYVTAINKFASPDELRYILEDSGAQALFLGPGTADAATGLVARDTVRYAVAFGSPPNGEDGWLDYAAEIASAPGTPLADQPRGGDMLYSSGTTGRPKGIRPPLPDRQVGEPGDSMVAVFGDRIGLDAETVFLSPAPLYHAAPLRLCATVQALGGTVVVMEKFDAQAALAAIEKYRVTHSQWVPTMFVRLLKLPFEVCRRYDLSSMKIAVHAAAPCPPEAKQQMLEWWGPILHEYYSSTEVAGMTWISPDEWAAHPGSVGRPILGILRICDEEGHEVPTGTVGTVYFERDECPFEYHNDPEKTRTAQHPQHANWTTVGDLGYVDDAGFLHLTDRKAFMIISGGVNIYPQEIEDALTMHPAVADVAVVGVPDPEMGEQVKAVVQLAEGKAGSPELEAELIAHVRSRLAAFKTPRTVDFVDSLPRTPTGKLVKGPLRDRYRAAAR
ncbi:acyl-CoA synthetase [Amycolatopsis echigonensis]|uniref:Acyl-CoA synthetase n=1 Tax=Amycolatopsis echigonensis TaxID=2576905 RepID=A0A2N3WPJ4_9PSEU|nr:MULTISPECIES: acyl-CoA synthetase [Amycolatopsis]MBB2502047.1 acyl-CoA synthetase [Amycolatopsis echigonensis]PKV95791.1 fatty-acyl-CoA synthase [Amycolatopsis niigatensis]